MSERSWLLERLAIDRPRPELDPYRSAWKRAGKITGDHHATSTIVGIEPDNGQSIGQTAHDLFVAEGWIGLPSPFGQTFDRPPRADRLEQQLAGSLEGLIGFESRLLRLLTVSMAREDQLDEWPDAERIVEEAAVLFGEDAEYRYSQDRLTASSFNQSITARGNGFVFVAVATDEG